MPFETYQREAEHCGGELISFLPEDYVISLGGVAEAPVFEDTTGTDGIDFLSADADGITIDGAGVVVNAGDSNDWVVAGAVSPNEYGNIDDSGHGDHGGIGTGTVDGGAGNDRITIDSGTTHGGEGSDFLTGWGLDGDGPGILYGNAGDDVIDASGDGSQAHGGTGNDYIRLRNGAVGYVGEGNDRLFVDAGTSAFGGDGDDMLTIGT